MKKITISVDDVTLAHLEVLRYCLAGNNSAIIRKAVDKFEESMRGTYGYKEAIEKYRAAHPEQFGA